MIPAAILAFLVGAVLAWGFRVWILFPVTILAFCSTMIFEVVFSGGSLAAIGVSLMISIMPQFGYAFGLFARAVLIAQRYPRRPSLSVLVKRRFF